MSVDNNPHHHSQIIIAENKNENLNSPDLLYLTKEYKDIKLKPNSSYKKKIKYNNPDDVAKVIQVSSNDEIIKIKTEELSLDFKSSKYIMFSIITPKTEGFYTAYIKIKNLNKDEIEEILKFYINITSESNDKDKEKYMTLG